MALSDWTCRPTPPTNGCRVGRKAANLVGRKEPKGSPARRRIASRRSTLSQSNRSCRKTESPAKLPAPAQRAAFRAAGRNSAVARSPARRSPPIPHFPLSWKVCTAAVLLRTTSQRHEQRQVSQATTKISHRGDRSEGINKSTRAALTVAIAMRSAVPASRIHPGSGHGHVSPQTMSAKNTASSTGTASRARCSFSATAGSGRPRQRGVVLVTS